MAADNDPYKPAEVEEDIPGNNCDEGIAKSSISSVRMNREDLKMLEESKDGALARKLREMLTGYGFTLLIVVLVSILAMYALDVILINFRLKNSQLLTPIFELSKFIVSTLLGYVFANNLGRSK